MRRGEIWLVDLEPIRGSEANKTRPAVIVTNDARNRAAERSGRGVLTVVPLTSNPPRVFPFQVLVPSSGMSGLTTRSKAQAEQVRSVDVDRLVARLGRLDADQRDEVDQALLLHLGLQH